MAASSPQTSSFPPLDFPSLQLELDRHAVPSWHFPPDEKWPSMTNDFSYLATPFPCRSINIRLGLPPNPSDEHLRAERSLALLLDNLLYNPLTRAQVHEHYALLCALKAFNRMHIYCSAHMLRFLALRQGSIGDERDTAGPEPRGGHKHFSKFILGEGDKFRYTIVGTEPCEQAYALQHDLSPEIVATLRAGLVSTTLVLRPGGVAMLRSPDPAVVDFVTEDDVIEALRDHNGICVLSYRHVMHIDKETGDRKTGLCERQLNSVRERLEDYNYVWIDTVHSRASQRKWRPACVALYAIFECIQTCDAIEQQHRTWLRTEALMMGARKHFMSNRSNSILGQALMSNYRDIQLRAAHAIVLGELNDTECTFEADKAALKEWAMGTTTWPKTVSSGSMTTRCGFRESMAARDHYEMNVLKQPFHEDRKPSVAKFDSPERLVLESIPIEKLNCHQEAFVLRFVMHVQLHGHCIYDEQEQQLYVFFGDVGVLGGRIFIYERVRVQNEGAWMHVTHALCVIKARLTHPEGILLSSAMMANSEGESKAKRCGHAGCCVPEFIVSGEEYEYKCRNEDITIKEEYKLLLLETKQPFLKLAQRIGEGVCYRKLCTTYFSCDMHQFYT